jgi:hypothetical protein
MILYPQVHLLLRLQGSEQYDLFDTSDQQHSLQITLQFLGANLQTVVFAK